MLANSLLGCGVDEVLMLGQEASRLARTALVCVCLRGPVVKHFIPPGGHDESKPSYTGMMPATWVPQRGATRPVHQPSRALVSGCRLDVVAGPSTGRVRESKRDGLLGGARGRGRARSKQQRCQLTSNHRHRLPVSSLSVSCDLLCSALPNPPP